MKFKLEFGMDNAAFEESPLEMAARILVGVTEALRTGWRSGGCLDANGNSVGRWEVSSEELLERRA